MNPPARRGEPPDAAEWTPRTVTGPNADCGGPQPLASDTLAPMTPCRPALRAILTIAALTATTLAGCGGSSLSAEARAACNGGQQTQAAITLAAGAPTSDLRGQADELGRRTWDVTLEAAAAAGDEHLQALAGVFGPYRSPLMQSDLTRLAQWCEENGWKPESK